MKISLGIIVSLVAVLSTSACGRLGDTFNNANDSTADEFRQAEEEAFLGDGPRPRNTLSSLFNRGDPETRVSVNRYIWAASLEVLDFLPIQTVDPFTGVIVTGFGTPPGSGRAYRATVLIDDPALDARSLNVALQSRSGPVSGSTVRAIEDAILTRARQLRVADSRL